MSRVRRNVDASARAHLIAHTKRTILDDVDESDPYFAAYRALADNVDAFLGASETAPVRQRPRVHRVFINGAVFVGASLAVGVGFAFAATQTGLVTVNDTLSAPPRSLVATAGHSKGLTRLPALTPAQLPLVPSDGRAAEWVQTAIAALAAQRQAEADAAAAAAAQAQAQSGGGQATSGGSSTGGGSTGGSSGSSGGSSSGGGTSAPAPYVDQLGFSASTTGAGTVSVTVNLHTTGSMSVSVSCTLGGTTQSMSGPGTVAGSASYSGSFTGLAPGTYSISCTVPGQMTSNTKSITVS